MPRKSSELSYTVVVRFGDAKACSWIRHGENFKSEAEAKPIVSFYTKQGNKALVFRTSHLDTVGLPESWHSTQPGI